nr:putative nuclease HARBI1 [Crassostrea gigas]XP_034313990.1 putative nuclease HARBI1 [Crassostrea gigas]
MRFLHLNACFPGSSHDAFVLSNSGLPTRITSLPEGGWLLGDSGYPLKNWLITPFATPRNDEERKFNDAHGRTRVVVERAFGVLKSRFRCLHKSGRSLPFSPLKCSRVIETCFRLHNMAIDQRVPLREGGRVVNVNHNAICNDIAQPTAQQTRQCIAELL